MLALLALPALAACEGGGGEDFAEARALVEAHGCGTCHVIPGLPGADGRTGPPLAAMDRQPYVAGVLPNTPEALAALIADPQAVDPRTAMPDLGVSLHDARLIGAYLRAAGGSS